MSSGFRSKSQWVRDLRRCVPDREQHSYWYRMIYYMNQKDDRKDADFQRRAMPISTIEDAPVTEQTECDLAEREEVRRAIELSMKSLTYQEREIIKLRFGLGGGCTYTLEEIGYIFKVTRDRVRQVEAVAIHKLQHPVRSKKLKQYASFPCGRMESPVLAATGPSLLRSATARHFLLSTPARSARFFSAPDGALATTLNRSARQQKACPFAASLPMGGWTSRASIGPIAPSQLAGRQSIDNLMVLAPRCSASQAIRCFLSSLSSWPFGTLCESRRFGRPARSFQAHPRQRLANRLSPHLGRVFGFIESPFRAIEEDGDRTLGGGFAILRPRPKRSESKNFGGASWLHSNLVCLRESSQHSPSRRGFGFFPFFHLGRSARALPRASGGLELGGG